MFKILKILISATIVLFIIGAIIYFLPAETKIKGIETITGIVPESVKEKVEELVLTPPEQRGKIINSLETNLENLKSDPTNGQARELIKNSEELITKLKEKNKAASLTEILSNKIAERLVNQIAGTSTQCQK